MPTLSPNEVERFHADGFLSPFTLCGESEMAAMREHLVASVFPGPGPTASPLQSRHLDSRLVWELCSHPAVVSRATALLGPDLVLWRSHFFDKPTGAKSVPWHQDFNYWPLDPLVNLTAWLAITESTVENSCVHVIPGSHRRIIRHVPVTTNTEEFGEKAEDGAFDPAKKIPLALRPGQFALFNERLLHWSAVNAGPRRTGLAIRMTIPAVRVFSDELFPGHGCIQLAGSDPLRKNRMVAPPV